MIPIAESATPTEHVLVTLICEGSVSAMVAMTLIRLTLTLIRKVRP